MITAAELAAEREASLARREGSEHRQRVESRARRILDGRWGGSRDELREAAIAELPWLGEDRGAADLAELLDVAAELQRTQRIRVDPSTVKVRQPEWELKARRGRPKRQAVGEVAEPDPEPEPDLEPEPELEPEPAPEPERKIVMAGQTESDRKTIDLRTVGREERLRLYRIVEELQDGTAPTPAMVRAAVAKAKGWQLTDGQAEHLIKKTRPARAAQDGAPEDPAPPKIRIEPEPSPQPDPADGPSADPPVHGAVDHNSRGVIQREDRPDGQSRVFIDVLVPTDVGHRLYLRAYAEVNDLAIPSHRSNGGSGA